MNEMLLVILAVLLLGVAFGYAAGWTVRGARAERELLNWREEFGDLKLSEFDPKSDARIKYFVQTVSPCQGCLDATRNRMASVVHMSGHSGPHVGELPMVKP